MYIYPYPSTTYLMCIPAQVRAFQGTQGDYRRLLYIYIYIDIYIYIYI